MGTGSAGGFEIRNAGSLIGVRARRQASVHISDPQHPATLRIKICVEYALATAELQFEAGAFAHLERRMAEITDEFICCKADQLARLRACLNDDGDWLRRRLLLLGGSGTAGNEKGQGKN